jgi:hypothetical protein
MAHSAPDDEDLERAVEARLSGKTWKQVGEECNRAESTVRRWPLLYAQRWREQQLRLERRVMAEATAEVIHTLRQQLRSEDDKARREAARHLIQLRTLLEKMTTTDEQPQHEASDAQRLLHYLESLSDDDLTRLGTSAAATGQAPRRPA